VRASPHSTFLCALVNTTLTRFLKKKKKGKKKRTKK